MAVPARILIAGGSGVFGRLLAEELLRATDARIVLAGRAARGLESARAALGGGERVTTTVVDLADPHALTEIAGGCWAVACTAGPFQSLRHDLPHQAVDAGAHWLDIADHDGWISAVAADNALSRRACDAGLVVAPGLSTTPAVSGALVRTCMALLARARRARITLFVGNRNPRGRALIASAISGGAMDRVLVDRGVHGRYTAYRCASADASLLARELKVEATFLVAPQWRLAGRGLAAASRLADQRSPRPLVNLLAVLSRLSGWIGAVGGGLEVVVDDGKMACSARLAGGQNMAVLPCVFAVRRLLGGTQEVRGVTMPSALLAPARLVAGLVDAGLELTAPELIALPEETSPRS